MSQVVRSFCAMWVLSASFMNGGDVATSKSAALIGNKEVVVIKGVPTLIAPTVSLAREADGRIKYRATKKSLAGHTRMDMASLSAKDRRKLDEDSKRYASGFDAMTRLEILKKSSLFGSNVLKLDGEVINTHGKNVSVIREAYQFEGGILAAIQTKGDTSSDGPVEIMFIDIEKKDAQFLFYGEKIYWQLKLVEAVD